ncbi:MAG: MFS transporter [Blastomonas sp.]|nr:MFS transporter [Blastomonas sp.]
MPSSTHKIESEFIFDFGEFSHARAAAFGIGSLATVIFIIAPQILLLFFMTEVLGIPAGWAGLGIAITKVVEVVSDVAIGTWSDRQSPRLTMRRRSMLRGALFFPLGFALVFAAPAATAWPVVLGWTMLASLAATLAYTTFSVPYITLVGEMSERPEVRLRLTAWRMAFVAVGVLVAGAAAPLMVDLAGGGLAGYRAMGAGFAVLMLASALTAWGTVPDRIAAARLPKRQPDLRSVLRVVTEARGYRTLWIGYVAQMAGISLNAALLPYAAHLVFRAGTDAVAGIFAAMTVATLLAMPVAVIAARRLGLVTAYGASLVVSAAGLAGMAAAQPAALWPAVVGAAIFGLGQAGATSLPFTLLPQALEDGNPDLARANAGALTGLWIAGEKLGLALGAALAGGLLGLSGYDSAASTQLPDTVAMIPWLFGPFPAAFMLLSAGLLRPLLSSTLNARLSS